MAVEWTCRSDGCALAPPLPEEWWLGLSLEPGLFHDGHAGPSSAATTGT